MYLYIYICIVGGIVVECDRVVCVYIYTYVHTLIVALVITCITYNDME